MFAEKIKEYGDKKSKAGGKMVDATAATNAELQAELDKVARMIKTNIFVHHSNDNYFQIAKNYGGGSGVDMTAFPELKFSEPTIDSINIA